MNLKINVCSFSGRKYWQWERSTLTGRAKSISLMVMIFIMKFRLAINRNLLPARAVNYFPISPRRQQPSHLYFFTKKVKDNMSPVSSWRYSSYFRKGQIRQLLRTLTAYFYVSSSSLVVWAVDGQRAIQEFQNSLSLSP